ncbi:MULTISPECIES: sugar ABC transporter permease [unclassified Streptococcus]|uniref:ABC transporter permease n=1 Tax=unclassified Streptococcus TaxID=2608887 RepID=UPI00107292B8|nr:MULTISPECIES: ABC transporter permease subunit [unclassified Streptococcus]MBF0787107.1 sugar ABC transporter permease [Streptococcus sp. 19428wC2_LYSM12]MCQ9211337.1 ABC transporter permease subunit [Streptococcus sp. B01]MCQ9214649.1 ABC transporter permease subunit [Streptococcus sp. O1]TFV05991.1 sugar ABC transporter permease [Streptococcus sp. LYSM12]
MRLEKATKNRQKWLKDVKKNIPFLLMLAVPLIFLIIFSYGPMYGVLIAFKKFTPRLGILGSHWNNFAHFKKMFSDFLFLRAIKNTLIISFLKILIGFPAPILLAILLSELKFIRFKKIAQTISYLPYFLSWVVIAAMMIEVFSPQRGIVNAVIGFFGVRPINFLSEESTFVSMLIMSDIWQSIGYGSIVYLAAITGVNPALYEAADLDGASRIQRIRYVTIPSIMPVILVMFLLRIGSVLQAGFDQVLNLYNPAVYNVADIIDTYVYRVGLIGFNFDYSTAVGLFQNAVGLVLVVFSNLLIKKLTGRKIL